VEAQPKAAVGELVAQGRGIGVAEAQLRVGHRYPPEAATVGVVLGTT
jgi:hypothetical protein